MKDRLCDSDQMTVRNFEYAVTSTAPIVAIFQMTTERWEFVKTAMRWDGITICQLEKTLGNSDLYAFPLGLNPNQIWRLLQKLENSTLASTQCKSL